MKEITEQALLSFIMHTAPGSLLVLKYKQVNACDHSTKTKYNIHLYLFLELGAFYEISLF